jgi:hypothetical protein
MDVASSVGIRLLTRAPSRSKVVEHLNRKENNNRSKRQNRKAGNNQTESRLTSFRPAWAPRPLRKQILCVPGILQNVRRIKWAPPGGCAQDSFLAPALLFFLRQLRSLLDFALEFLHLPAQIFFLFLELVLFRPDWRIVKSFTSHHTRVLSAQEIDSQQRA